MTYTISILLTTTKEVPYKREPWPHTRTVEDTDWHVRFNNVLPFRSAKDGDDEKHVHPLQLDVIERACVMWSNPGEKVLTPFMGVGSEVYGAVINGRRGIGIELKPSYYRQAVRNLAAIEIAKPDDEKRLFDLEETTA